MNVNMDYILKYINADKQFVRVLSLVRYYIVFKMNHFDVFLEK